MQRRAALRRPAATTAAAAGSTARTLWIAAPPRRAVELRHALGPRLGARVAKARAAAVQVAGVEQDDPDPGLGGGGEHARPISLGSAYGAPPGPWCR